MKLKDFIKIYAVILLAHTAAQTVAKDFSFIFFTKLLIPLSVFLYNFYYNVDKVSNILISSSIAFFILGNILMMVNPEYDPCKFDTPMLAYSAAFTFLSITALTRTKFTLSNMLIATFFTLVNGVLSYLYIFSSNEAGNISFYLFVAAFLILTATTLVHSTTPQKKYFLIGGLAGISVSNHLLSFCNFRENLSFVVPVAMLLYGIGLLGYMVGFLEATKE
ncbi:hypothetical protein [Schleiferia thermophila]|uniref:Uncharacterized protein n=1 Tax=Schleiferia thermophila TaxID=884107 RepID=A0A369A906_9FLAO|nr:hypothetical protein [Schleiferia thermophila]RCX05611.1 hypothetical protein DES35_101899 [Schleiferia thermophila]GCD78894.1 hypothetical protein JCM30197_01410 [Schleiferia thermophila]